MSYQTVILGSWTAFIIVWVVASFGAKRDIRGSSASSVLYRSFILKVIGIALVVFAALRVVTGTDRYAMAGAAIFRDGTFTPPLALGWIAAALVVLGILFAIWARINLGRNWSSAPAVKENPKLVTSGPYRFVRHPIYTGVLLAAFGTAWTSTAFGIGLFLIASIMFSLRIHKEEQIMLKLFPNEYSSYQARTRRLIPFVW
jgi:protein-S-isoprenylcysteine O-methyltransferase